MNPPARKSRKALRGGAFSVFLALLLFLMTAVGFFLDLSPGNTLSRSWRKTMKDLSARDGILLFLGEALTDGEFRAVGEQDEISFTSSLPEGAALSIQGDGGEVELISRGEKVALQSDALSDNAFSADRGSAADELSRSAFSDAGLPEEYMLLFRSYLAATNEDMISCGETFSDYFQTLFHAADPSLKTRSAEKEAEGEREKGKEYLYQIDREGIARLLAAFAEQGKRDEVQEKAGSLWSLVSALSGDPADEEKKEAFLSFLSGSGEGFDRWQKALGSSDAKGEITFFVSSGRVRSAVLLLSGGEFSLRGEITFGANLKKDGSVSLSLSASEGETEVLSFAFSHEIREDSDSALIRRLTASFSDPAGIVLSEKEKTSAEVTFSWGKKKGDLGLRFVMDEKELNFRGAAGEYKKGKELTFTLKRIEIDCKNILKNGALSVTVTKKGSLTDLPAGERELFPSGEGREELASSLRERFETLFPKED